MGKIKINLSNGAVLEKPLVTCFKGTKGTYVVLDNETNGSMGLPIICISRFDGNTAEKVLDQVEWQSIKEDLKSILSGKELPYVSVPESLTAAQDFYTQLTLPLASFDTLKTLYKPETVSMDTPQISVESTIPELTPSTPVMPSIPEINPLPDMQVNPEPTMPSAPEVPVMPNIDIPTVPVGPDTQMPQPMPTIAPVSEDAFTAEPISNPEISNTEVNVVPPVVPMPNIDIPTIPVTPIAETTPVVETPVAPVEPVIPEITSIPEIPSMPEMPVIPEIPVAPVEPIPSGLDINPVPSINDTVADETVGYNNDEINEMKEVFLKSCESMFDSLVEKLKK